MSFHLDAFPRHFSGKKHHENISDCTLKRALQNICSNHEITEIRWSNLCNLKIACPNNAENSKVKKTGRLHNLKIICSKNCGTFQWLPPKQTTASSTKVFPELSHIAQLYNWHGHRLAPKIQVEFWEQLATVHFKLKFQNLQNILQAASFSWYFKMI